MLAGCASILFAGDEGGLEILHDHEARTSAPPPGRGRAAARSSQVGEERPALGHRSDLGHADREEVERLRERLAVEVAAETISPLSAKQSGLSVTLFTSVTSTSRA